MCTSLSVLHKLGSFNYSSHSHNDNNCCCIKCVLLMQKELVYADLHHSTNPPAPPLPVEPVPVQYATVKAQTAIKDKVTGKLHVYADLHHSTNPPAPPLPAESFQKGIIMFCFQN